MRKTIVENMLESQAVELMEYFAYCKKHVMRELTPDYIMSWVCSEMRKKKYLKFIRKKAKEKRS